MAINDKDKKSYPESGRLTADLIQPVNWKRILAKTFSYFQQ